MHPAGNWLPKRWPKENFARLADELIERFNTKIIFSGSQNDSNIISDILSLMENKAVDLAGRITLKQLGAVFMRANLVVSADSGPLHISIALNRPTIALFGPTSVDITGPLTKENIIVLQKYVGCVIPCYKQDCLDNRCMKQISVQEVLDCIREKRWLTKER
jgi:ADP-heptose:LPS heptosyltransferase